MSIGIPRNPPPTAIPADATCQEASALSYSKYIACGASPVVAVIDNRDQNLYYMCLPCADHNCRNRRAKLVLTTHPELLRRYGGTLVSPEMQHGIEHEAETKAYFENRALTCCHCKRVYAILNSRGVYEKAGDHAPDCPRLNPEKYKPIAPIGNLGEV